MGWRTLDVRQQMPRSCGMAVDGGGMLRGNRLLRRALGCPVDPPQSRCSTEWPVLVWGLLFHGG